VAANYRTAIMNPTAQPPGPPPVTLPAPDPATVEQLIHYGTLLFEQSQLWFGHGTDNAFDEAAELVFFGAGLRHEEAADAYSTQVGAAERAAVLALFKRRIRERIPAAYLTHRMWFAGQEFYVDERVLVPRSPLAELVEAQFQPWIAPEKIHRLLDIGTGSGCIAIASALAVPQARVDATDISDAALAVTAINIATHGVQDRVRAIRSDVYAALRGERYDIIVSNPPYVGDEEMAGLPEEYRHEPATGLHSGVDGLDVVRRILSGAAAHLEPHGILIVEVGNSETALTAAFPNVPFTWLEFERGGGGVFLLSAEQLESLHVR
jgi:ribosomal protein L3 glutamine methyltransferase